MVGTIKFYDPNELPYGPFSNNYVQIMDVDSDGERWKSVTNYAYSKILTTPLYRRIIQTAPPSKIHSEFNKLYTSQTKESISKSIDEALAARLSTAEELQDALYRTENAPIEYVSPDEILGTGTTGAGDNILGKKLMEARHRIKIQRKKVVDKSRDEEKLRKMYELYRAYVYLTNQMKSENEDLSQYLSKPYEEIVKLSSYTKIFDFNTFKELITRGSIPKVIEKALYNPNLLVLQIRKERMSSFRKMQLKVRCDIIFDMYTSYMLEKNYPDLPPANYGKAKSQQMDKLSWEQKTDLKLRVCALYDQEFLSGSLSDKIAEVLNTLVIPTEEEVAAAEAIDTFGSNVEEKPMSEGLIDRIIGNEPTAELPTPNQPENEGEIGVVQIFANPDEGNYPILQKLSPGYEEMFKLKTMVFPNIMMYVLFNLILLLPEIRDKKFDKMKVAYSTLLVDPTEIVRGPNSFKALEDMDEQYHAMRDMSFEINLKEYADKALSKKFENRRFQDLLLTTGNTNLVYNDRQDSILGVGKNGDGQNYTGGWLEAYRKDLAIERRGEDVHSLSEKDIVNMIEQRPFIKKWIEMRVDDMIKTFNKYQNYVFQKDERSLEKSPTTIGDVIDTYYDSCNIVGSLARSVVAPVPKYFVEMIKKKPGFDKVNVATVKVIWTRVAVVIFFLRKYMTHKSAQNIENILTQLEYKLSKKKKCKGILEDEKDNCIFSAIVNILDATNELNDTFAIAKPMDVADIELATSIILNRSVELIEHNEMKSHMDILADMMKQEKKEEERMQKILKEGDADIRRLREQERIISARRGMRQDEDILNEEEDYEEDEEYEEEEPELDEEYEDQDEGGEEDEEGGEEDDEEEEEDEEDDEEEMPDLPDYSVKNEGIRYKPRPKRPSNVGMKMSEEELKMRRKMMMESGDVQDFMNKFTLESKKKFDENKKRKMKKQALERAMKIEAEKARIAKEEADAIRRSEEFIAKLLAKNKGKSKKKPKAPEEEEEEEVEEEEEEEEPEVDAEDIEWDFDEDEEYSSSFAFDKNDAEIKAKIVSFVNEQYNNVENAELFAEQIMEAISTVKTYRISESIKINRINFFGTML